MISKKTMRCVCGIFLLTAPVVNGELQEGEGIRPPVFAGMSDEMGQRRMSGPRQMSGSGNMQRNSPDFGGGFSRRPPTQMRGMGMERRMGKRSGAASVLRRQVVELAMQYEETDSEKTKTEIKEKLKKVLSQLFEQTLIEQEQNIERLKKEIQRKEKLIATSKQQKERLIDKRLDKLTGDDEELDF